MFRTCIVEPYGKDLVFVPRDHSFINWTKLVSDITILNATDESGEEQWWPSGKALGLQSKKTGVRFSASPIGFSEIDYLLLPSRDMAEIPLKRRKSSIQPTNQPTNESGDVFKSYILRRKWWALNVTLITCFIKIRVKPSTNFESTTTLKCKCRYMRCIYTCTLLWCI